MHHRDHPYGTRPGNITLHETSTVISGRKGHNEDELQLCLPDYPSNRVIINSKKFKQTTHCPRVGQSWKTCVGRFLHVCVCVDFLV